MKSIENLVTLKSSLPADSYVLDISIWRCGGDDDLNEGITSLGTMDTRFLDSSGRMCCLGQVAVQEGENLDYIVEAVLPMDLYKYGNAWVYEREFGGVTDSILSEKALKINDSSDTTIAEKAYQLKHLFQNHGKALYFINGEEYGVESTLPGWASS